MNERTAQNRIRTTTQVSRPDRAGRSARLRLPTLPLLLMSLLGFYVLMFLRYRPYDIDNPWFLSFSYDTFVERVTSDQFMNVAFPGGMNGTQLFGKLAAITQYLVARVAGWHQRPMELLSALCVVLSLYIWSLKLKKLGYGNRFVLSFVLIAGISEPFLATAEKMRYEYLSLLLISLGLLLLAHRRFAVGMFIVALAFEIEPMAILGMIPATVLAYSMNADRFSVTRRIVVGAVPAWVICLCLHPEILHIHLLLAHAPANDIKMTGGIFRAYFLSRLRHLPELVVFAVAGWIYWRRHHSFGSYYLGISAAVLVAVAALVPHGNVAYFIFVYPFLLGVALVAFQAERRALWIVILAVVYLVPQYVWLSYTNRGMGYRTKDIRQASQAIDGAEHAIGVADSDVRIYGDYGLWFAHPRFYRAASESTLTEIKDANLYLCYERPIEHGGMAATNTLFCPEIRQNVSLKLISTTVVRGNRLYLYAKQD